MNKTETQADNGDITINSDGGWFYAVQGQAIIGEFHADCWDCAWRMLNAEYPGARLGCWAGPFDGKGCLRKRKTTS